VNIDDEVLYNTSREFFMPLQGEAKSRTEGFKELVLIYGTTEESFRKPAALINRVRHQAKGGTPSRTIRDHAEHEGSKMQAHLEQTTRTILHENGFTEAGESPKVIRGTFGHNVTIEEEESLEDIVRTLDIEDQCKSAILKNPVLYEDTKEAVHISVDEVGAKKQKENREKKTQDSPSEPKRKYVQNTVIHIEKEGASYILNGYGRLCVLRMLLAFYCIIIY
jgi:hypothetical protein